MEGEGGGGVGVGASSSRGGRRGGGGGGEGERCLEAHLERVSGGSFYVCFHVILILMHVIFGQRSSKNSDAVLRNVFKLSATT